MSLFATALFFLVRIAEGRAATPLDLTLLYGPPRAAPATGPLRTLPPPLDATQTLREAAAAAGIHVGAAINYGGMHGNYGPNYAATALREFNLFTAENECKVGPIHPGVNQYAFEQCDFIIGTAIANGSLPRMCVSVWWRCAYAIDSVEQRAPKPSNPPSLPLPGTITAGTRRTQVGLMLCTTLPRCVLRSLLTLAT